MSIFNCPRSEEVKLSLFPVCGGSGIKLARDVWLRDKKPIAIKSDARRDAE